ETVSSSGQRPDLQVAEPDRIAMVLQYDIAALLDAETGIFGELAGLIEAVPAFAPDLVLDHLLAIQPVLDVVAARNDARLVPLPCRADDTGRRRDHVVQRARPAVTIHAGVGVRVTLVIEDLHLRTGVPRCLRVLRRPIDHPAVPPLRDPPVV